MYEVQSGLWDEEKNDWDPQAFDGLDQHVFETLLEAVVAVTSGIEDGDHVEIDINGSRSYIGILITKSNSDTWSYEILKK